MISKSLLFFGAAGFPALAAAGAIVGKGYVSYSITVVQLQDACRVVGGIAERQQSVDLDNAHSNQVYLIDLDIGTPGQDAVVQLDTGSDELWVNPKCSSSNDPSFCQSLPQWSSTGSSSQSDSTLGTNTLTYGSGDVSFKYVEDVVTVGAAQVKGQTFGVASSSRGFFTGILGIGPVTSSAEKQYDRFINSLTKQGFTNSNAFSLDLRDINEADGAIIFGGIDTKKFTGPLTKFPIPADTQNYGNRYFITLDSMAVTLEDGTSQALDIGGSILVLLDSGSTTSYLPQAAFDAFITKVNAKPIEGTSPTFYSVDCNLANEASTLDHTFGSLTVEVPYKDFIGPTFDDAGNCPLQIQPQGNNPLPYPILGDAFLRAAYVVHDQDNRDVHLAQAANCGSNIIAIGSGADAVPSLTGDCPKPVRTTKPVNNSTTTTGYGWNTTSTSTSLPSGSPPVYGNGTNTTYYPPTHTTSYPTYTSTIYSTNVYTASSCSAYAVNCHVGQLTTEIATSYTTYCPGKPSGYTPTYYKPPRPVTITKLHITGICSTYSRWGSTPSPTVGIVNAHPGVVTSAPKPTYPAGGSAPAANNGGSSPANGGGNNSVYAVQPASSSIVYAGAGKSAVGLGGVVLASLLAVVAML